MQINKITSTNVCRHAKCEIPVSSPDKGHSQLTVSSESPVQSKNKDLPRQPDVSQRPVQRYYITGHYIELIYFKFFFHLGLLLLWDVHGLPHLPRRAVHLLDHRGRPPSPQLTGFILPTAEHTQTHITPSLMIVKGVLPAGLLDLPQGLWNGALLRY